MGSQTGRETKDEKSEMEALFMERYLEHNNASEAYAEAGFAAPTSGARRTAACRLLKKLQPEIMKLRAQRGLTWDAVVTALREAIITKQ